jgi:immunoglobulin-binding protein 1
MTLEYHLAELMQRATSSDREAALKSALEQYEKYLMRLDEYLLLSGGDKKLFEQYMANSTSFTLAPANDAAARREIKVTRFREEKELKQKLEVRSKDIRRVSGLFC